MTTSSEQRRRRDEQVQQELMGGMQRILDVLHDISDGVREIQATAGRTSRRNGNSLAS